MMDKLKKLDGGVVIAGDGRHDSMGHSAKFCAYTIFCCPSPMIIHFDIVQVLQCNFLNSARCFFKDSLRVTH